MELIFIVEDGIKDIGGFQGDLEYIPFSRNNPEVSFPKINEMISSLLKSEVRAKEEGIEKTYEQELSKSDELLKEVKTEKEVQPDYTQELIDAIEKHDEKNEKEIFAKYIKECHGNKYDEISRTCSYYMFRHWHGEKNEFERMKLLSSENPSHSMPHLWLGFLLNEYKMFEKASEEYTKAAELSKAELEKTRWLCMAAQALLKGKKIKESKEIIFKRLNEVDKKSDLELYEIFKCLASIELEENNLENHFSFCEKALDLKPSDSTFRFKLARSYSEHKKHKLSLYHYKILCDTTPDGGGWNNLGVEYSELELESKAVSSYKKAEERGNTIATGNLAFKLINAGFLDDASDRLEKAIKEPECDSNVGEALARIDKVKESETKKEGELLSTIKQELDFRVSYSEAYVDPLKIELPKNWKTKYGEINVEVRADQFSAYGEIEFQSGLLASMFSTTPAISTYQKKKFRYIGKMKNRAVDYELKIETGPKEQFEKPFVQEELFTGQMIIHKDCKIISMLEKDEKGNLSFYELKVLL